MAFWTVTRQTKGKLQLFSNELWRCSALLQVSRPANRPFSSFSFMVDPINRNSTTRACQLEFFCNVRLFAAPAQAFQKKEEKTSEPRLNERITAQFVRLVIDEGHSIISRSEALEMAKQLKLDLVEVDRMAKPPVCKIMDYHKEKFLRKMREKERYKNRPELKNAAFKEVRFAAKINQKDLQMKADMAKRLMDNGHRVKCTAIEPTEDLDLPTLLSRFIALIRDVAYEENEPKVEKKQVFVVVRHVKYGPKKKKSSGKPYFKVAESTLKVASPDSELLLDKSEAISTESALHPHDDDDFGAISDMEDAVKGNGVDKQSEVFNEKLPSPRRNSEHLFESASVNRVPFVPTETPKGKENRYARDPRNTVNNVFKIPDQGKQPQFDPNRSSQPRQHERLKFNAPEVSKQANSQSDVRFSSINTDGHAARNRVDGSFQVPIRLNQAPRQDSSHPSIPTSPAKSYGIFSSQQTGNSSHDRRLPAENNRYGRKDPSNSARS